MRNPTEMMRAILTNEKAQEIIDYIAPIYGNSYVGLWILQAIGTVLWEVCNIADQLKYETNAATADILLDYWEDYYKIARDPTMTNERRRARLIARTQSRGPCNPVRLAAAVSGALGGVPVEITENIAKNTFLVNIREVVPSIGPAVAVLERMKPAHLIYEIQIATQTVSEAELKTAIAMTYAEHYKKVEVQQ